MSELDECWSWCPGGHDGWCEVAVGHLAQGLPLNLSGDRKQGWQDIDIDEAELDATMAGVLAAVVAGNLPRITAAHDQYGETQWEHVAWCCQQHEEGGPCDEILLHTEGATTFYLQCDPNEWPQAGLLVTDIPARSGGVRDLRLGLKELVDLLQLLPVAIQLVTDAAQPSTVTQVDTKADKLRLARRVRLAVGEHLIASDRIRPPYDDYGNELLIAMIGTPSGRQLRLGIVHLRDRRRWVTLPYIDDDNDGTTVLLDEAGIAQLDGGLAAVEAAAAAIRDRLIDILLRNEAIPDDCVSYNTEWMPRWEPGSMSSAEFHEHCKLGYRFADSVTPEQRAAVFEHFDYAGFPQYEAVVASGPWGDLLCQITPSDECPSDDVVITVDFVVRPADAAEGWKFRDVIDYDGQVRFSDSYLPKLRRKLAKFCAAS